MIIANAAVPTLGLVDTAVIGRGGEVADLGAIALGALIFSFVYWSFGFLRMGTTGFIAQADGAGNEPEVRATFARAGFLALGLGVILLALQKPIGFLALKMLSAGDGVESLARDYFDVRIFGAPASLMSITIIGVLIGLGETKILLWIQLFLNTLNIVLDLLFAGVFGWGVRGVALGTVISEWLSVALGLYLVFRLLRKRHVDDEPFLPTALVRSGSLIKSTLVAHRDILIRTVLLLFSFAWFTQQGAKFGDEVLAANHVLLQFVTFAAFFLDGIAFSAESFVGSSVGAKDLARFNLSVKRSNVMAFVLAVGLAAVLALGGKLFIGGLTDIEEVKTLASSLLILPVIYIVVAVWAFQYDGIFIGITRTKEMRNAAIVSTAAFLLLSLPMIARWENTGLWIAFIIYAGTRSLSLVAYMPRVRLSIAATSEEAPIV
jgi:MATE family multidrug resistance protein